MINFLHIPKCGGSTVRDYLRKYFNKIRNNEERTIPLKSIFVYGKTGKMGDLNIGNFKDESLDEFYGRGGDGICGIVGHYKYDSLALFLGNNNTYGNTFTLVRDPIDRMISNVNYLKLNVNHRAHKRAADLNQRNIVDYLISAAKTRNAGSFQCNFLGANIDIARKVDASYLVENVFIKINIYKIESTLLAINNHLLYIRPGFNLDKKNITPQAKINSEDFELIHKNMIANDRLAEIKQLYSNDYVLYGMAL